MTKLELTDKEVSSVVVAIDFLAKYIKGTADKPDELTAQKKELIKQLTNVMTKLDEAV